MTSSRRILCLAPSWLGDAVLSLPAFAVLREAGVHAEVLARQGVGRIYLDRLDAQCLHETSSRSRWQRWNDAWQLRPRRYDAALVFPPSFSAACMACVTGSPVRVGERGDGRSLLLTHRLPRASRDFHLARHYEHLARTTLGALGLPVPPPREEAHREPHLEARPAERQAAVDLLIRHGLDASDAPLVVAPGARFGPAKRYPPERFATAARLLGAALQAPVVLVGSDADRSETAAVRAHLPQAVDLAGETTMPVLFGVLAAARGVLSNDSGIMHLAAALGTPVVAVFGSTHPAWTAPLGPRTRIVQNRVSCAPCYRKRCPIDFPCMLGVEPERLVASMQALLAEAGPGRPEKAAPL